eukprot:4493147-Alexandrium_andersonii.AAC.1
MLLHPAIAERSPVYVSCQVRSLSAADGGSHSPRGSSVPAEGGRDGFPDRPIRRLFLAAAAWAKEGTD